MFEGSGSSLQNSFYITMFSPEDSRAHLNTVKYERRHCLTANLRPLAYFESDPILMFLGNTFPITGPHFAKLQNEGI